MNQLPSADEEARARMRAHVEAWADHRAWLAWQVRVPFTYANGSTRMGVPPRSCWPGSVVLVTPPPEAR